MRDPLLVAWRVALGAGAGTIVGVFGGFSLFGASTTESGYLLNCIGLGTVAGGVLTWLWERWKQREAEAASRPDPFVALPRKDDGEQ